MTVKNLWSFSSNSSIVSSLAIIVANKAQVWESQAIGTIIILTITKILVINIEIGK